MHDWEAIESDSTTAAMKLRGRMVPMDSALRTPVPKIYGVENWGQGYFDVNPEGHLTVRPLRDDRHVDIYKEVRALVDQRHLPPLLVRFPQILDSQVRALQRAFANSIREFDYPRSYQGVFPMKVNPQRVVVERLLEAGAESKLDSRSGANRSSISAWLSSRHPAPSSSATGSRTKSSWRWPSGGTGSARRS